LTLPIGKLDAVFDAGRIRDNLNPLDTIDIGDSHFTEIEFCIEATNDAIVGETYEFRITKG
jgi:hypothetical protein